MTASDPTARTGHRNIQPESVNFYSDPNYFPIIFEMAVDAAGNLTIEGALTEMSDRNAKQDVEQFEGDSVLHPVAGMPVSEWSYRSNPSSRHTGPMAQDFHAAFGLGDDDTHLSPRSMSGVNMAAIKTLHQQNVRLVEEIAELRRLIEGQDLAH